MKKKHAFWKLLLFLAGLYVFISAAGFNKKQYLSQLPSTGSKMVYIPAGSYYIGDHKTRDNSPARLKTFQGFFIDIHPVTNIQYLSYLIKSGYVPQSNFNQKFAREKPYFPAVNLSLQDASSFARFFAKRLPTEWEWEVAARSLKKNYSKDLELLLKEKKGNFFSMDNKTIKPILNFPQNRLGLFDTLGNIFEWTSSLYPLELLLSSDKIKAQELYVLKGGSWTNIRNDINFSTRTPFPGNRTLNWLGFRCVRNTVKKK